MTLRCLIFGHRRSRSRATFDDKHQYWLSECKRCHLLLVREAGGRWIPAPPQPEKLEPIERPDRVNEEKSATAGDTEESGEQPRPVTVVH
jgi:hypothetical protein